MDRSRLEESVNQEIQALRQRLALLSDVQLSALVTFLRAVVPAHATPTLM